MEVSDILLLFFGSMIATLAIMASRALTEKHADAIHIKVRMLTEEELRKKKINALYGRDKD